MKNRCRSSDYMTIQDKLDYASKIARRKKGKLVFNLYIKPGRYTENIQLSDGQNLTGNQT